MFKGTIPFLSLALLLAPGVDAFARDVTIRGQRVSCAQLQAIGQDEQLAQAFLDSKRAAAALRAQIQAADQAVRDRRSRENWWRHNCRQARDTVMQFHGAVSRVKGVIAAKGVVLKTVAAAAGVPLTLKAAALALLWKSVGFTWGQACDTGAAYNDYEVTKLVNRMNGLSHQVQTYERQAQQAWDLLVQAKALHRQHCR